MAETTKIEWASATFNPWEGCTKVSAACDHCYAETRNKRFSAGANWGPKAPRRRTSAANWRKPISWNVHPEKLATGHRPRIFGGSLCDVFDNAIDPSWRADYWSLIRKTPNLDWLLLTKRPQNIAKMLPPDWGTGWPNVWLGATVENQDEAERRIPHLLRVPAVIRFLSCEPLLGPVNLEPIRTMDFKYITTQPVSVYTLGGRYQIPGSHWSEPYARINWVIVGGETGTGARMMQDDWALSLLHQCRESGTPYFLKQMTNKAPIPPAMLVREFPNGDTHGR